MPRALTVAGAVGMLVVSNLFMLTAWYWHMKPGSFIGRQPLWAVILLSWCIALLEYVVMIPANRIGGAAGFTVGQLKIVQEVVTVGVFVPFVVFFMGEKWRWDYLWALLCMVGAVYFVNRAR